MQLDPSIEGMICMQPEPTRYIYVIYFCYCSVFCYTKYGLWEMSNNLSSIDTIVYVIFAQLKINHLKALWSCVCLKVISGFNRVVTE